MYPSKMTMMAKYGRHFFSQLASVSLGWGGCNVLFCTGVLQSAHQLCMLACCFLAPDAFDISTCTDSSVVLVIGASTIILNL